MVRANSKLTSSDYFMPALGVIFLRQAANRFEAARRQIEEDQTAGRMPKRKVRPEDYLRRRALCGHAFGTVGGFGPREEPEISDAAPVQY